MAAYREGDIVKYDDGFVYGLVVKDSGKLNIVWFGQGNPFITSSSWKDFDKSEKLQRELSEPITSISHLKMREFFHAM